MAMPNFALTKKEARITNINLRVEHHGDENKRGVDLTIATRAENMILDSFDRGLKETFFRKPGKGEQPDLPNISENKLTQVAYSYLSEQKLPHTFEGYEMELAGLLDHIEPVFLADVSLKKFEFKALEGGFLELKFTVSASDITSEELVELDAAQLRGAVRITLKRPDEQEQKQAA